MRRWMILLGFLGILVGLGFVFPAVAHVREHGGLPPEGFVLLPLGLLLCFGGIGSIAYGVKKSRA